MTETEEKILSVLSGIEKRLSNLENAPPDVVQYPGASPPHLENCTSGSVLCTQFGSEKSLPDERSDSMQHRLRVQTGTDQHGKPIVRQLRADSELDLAEAVARALVQSGRIYDFLPQLRQPSAPKTLFSDYVRKWRVTYKQDLADNTVVFLDAKENVLNRFFGSKYIEDITPDDVQRFLRERSSCYKRPTVRADWAMLKEIFDSAMQDGIISANPAKDKRLKNTAPSGTGTAALTRQQMTDICESIPSIKDDRERLLLALFTYTSMRREEVLGLKWENVDFTDNVLLIDSAVVYPRGQPVLKGTKTASSVRRFPMGTALREILYPLRRPSGFILSASNGRKPLSEPTYRRLWKSLSSHVNLYGMTAKNFRTSFATLAVASGVDIRTTQSLMGHSTPEMTLKVYTKQEQSQLPASISRIESYITSVSK